MTQAIPVTAPSLTGSAPTRRDRMRAATMEEITATARRLLVEQGPEAASLRAIAREMGMTAPGLYRYYGSREELLRHVIATMFPNSPATSTGRSTRSALEFRAARPSPAATPRPTRSSGTSHGSWWRRAASSAAGG